MCALRGAADRECCSGVALLKLCAAIQVRLYPAASGRSEQEAGCCAEEVCLQPS